MTQKAQNSKERRRNISLTGDSALLLDKLQIAVEKRLGIRVTTAFVIKLCLNCQASVEKLD